MSHNKELILIENLLANYISPIKTIKFRQMKSLKQIPLILLISIVMMSFSKCNDESKLETQAPIEIGDVYYKTWVAGARWGGSGINLFIPIKSNPNKIILDSVYFLDKMTKLEHIGDTLVVGRFETDVNKQLDIVMSGDPNEEYGNAVPKLKKNIPFELKENECVVSYISNNKTRYFKIDNIIKKEEIHQFPSIKPQ